MAANKKKRPHKQRKAAMPPMLVMRHIHDVDLSTKEIVAGSTREDRKYAQERAETQYIPALNGIKERMDRTGKLGVNAEELKMLNDLIDFSKQFWARQPIDLYKQVGDEVNAFYAELKDQREQSALEDEPAKLGWEAD